MNGWERWRAWLDRAYDQHPLRSVFVIGVVWVAGLQLADFARGEPFDGVATIIRTVTGFGMLGPFLVWMSRSLRPR